MGFRIFTVSYTERMMRAASVADTRAFSLTTVGSQAKDLDLNIDSCQVIAFDVSRAEVIRDISAAKAGDLREVAMKYV